MTFSVIIDNTKEEKYENIGDAIQRALQVNGTVYDMHKRLIVCLNPESRNAR